jgi:hypothetical protein
MSSVPPLRRYHADATTSRDVYPVTYGFASGPHAMPPPSLPLDRRLSRGPRALSFRRRPYSGCGRMDAIGISQVPRRSVPYLCPAATPRPDRRLLAMVGTTNAAPAFYATKAPARYLSRGQYAASVPAAYASRAMSPPPMQGSLPAGWLAFTGRESNPLDRDERFQLHTFPFPGLVLSLVKSNRSALQSVGIGEILRIWLFLCRKRLFPDSEPRCTT